MAPYKAIGYMQPRVVSSSASPEADQGLKKNINEALCICYGIKTELATHLSEDLTSVLAQRVMGWRVAPERFMVGKGRWLPRWRFQPAERLEDAFRLLEQAAPQRYSMGRDGQGTFWVRVQIGQETGRAHDLSKPRAITLAVARALKLTLNP